MCRLSIEVRRTIGTSVQNRFKEHIRDIKNNGQNSKFAQHVLDTKHGYVTMEKTEIPTYRKKTDARYL